MRRERGAGWLEWRSIAILVSVTACVPRPATCIANGDCPAQESCVGGRCVEEDPLDESCETTGDCPPEKPPIDPPCLDESTCNPPPNGCASDTECDPPGVICESAACVPGCVAGMACSANSVCNTLTGRCQALTGPCTTDEGCSPPMSVCESGQCIPGCGLIGGVQCAGASGCDMSTGRCVTRTDICVSDLDCDLPSTVCNLNTGACDPGCTPQSCMAPATCDPATGHCNGSAICNDDIFEDNDSVSAPSILSGSLLNIAACPNDDDVYEFFLAAGDDIDVEALFVQGEGNLDLELLDPLGDIAASSRTTASNERIMFAATSAGQHHLRVFTLSDLGPTLGVPYSLNARITLAPCAMDNLEPNNARASAAQISPATHSGLSICVGDDDYYAVQLSAGQQVTVTVDHSLSEGDIDLLVTNAAGTSTWSTSGSRTPETVSLAINASGQYIIRVYLTSDPGVMQGNGYTLTISP